MNKPNAIFPCLRSRMGDWWYYIAVMTFRDVDRWVKPVADIHQPEDLKTWIQRKITPERTQHIADYLVQQKQHFFNAIVVGIYEGEPEWYPIQVGTNPAMPKFYPQEKSKGAFGFLLLNGDEKIFAIDGQHRVEGIRPAIVRKEELSDDQQCVIFVSHKETVMGRSRTRRLFSTLNKYAKPVSKGELVALNEDDTFAIVTRKLIDQYRPLNILFVPLTKNANIPLDNRQCVTTVLGLYDLVRTLAIEPGDPRRRKLEIGPSQSEWVSQIYDQFREFWDLLKEHVEEFEEVANSVPALEIAGRYRTRDGGHVLFRPVGMKAFAQAARILVNRGSSWRNAVASLSQTSLDLNSPPWAGVLWNSFGHRVINKNAKLAYNLFLHMAGEPLAPAGYELLNEYRRSLDDSTATLPRVQ